MQIEISSRLDPSRTYLSADIKGDTNAGYAVTSLTSPIEKVRQYYANILKGDFDYSFFTACGQHLFYGTETHQARNLLLAVAQEAAKSGRKPKFSPSSTLLQGWFAGSELAEALLKIDRRAISQISAVIGQDSAVVSDFAAWLYYYIQASLLSGTVDSSTVGKLILAFIADDTAFSASLLSALDQLDPTFLGLWADEGSYQALRRRAITNQEVLRLLGSFSPQSDVRARRPSRSSDRLSIAARGATRNAILENPSIWETVERALTTIAPSPAPTYLPPPGNPEKVAYNVLKHFNFALPPLDEVARVLGTQIVLTDLPNDVLGLFVANTEAHHSAILLNRTIRTEGARRFTICHELGHYLLHHDRAFLCGYKEIYEYALTTEAEANAFAAELIMPTALMRDAAVKPFNTDTVVNVARQFNCSIEAAARRLIDLSHQRKLALIVVMNGRIISVSGSRINQEGLRWIGKLSTGATAVSVTEAATLHDLKESRLGKFLPSAQAEWLRDLEIDLYPFGSHDGYYLFLELSD